MKSIAVYMAWGNATIGAMCILVGLYSLSAVLGVFSLLWVILAKLTK